MDTSQKTQISKIPKREIQIEENVDNGKIIRTLASICGFSVNYYLMIKLVKEVSSESTLFFWLLTFVLIVLSYRDRDASYIFGGLATVYCPYIILSAGLTVASGATILTTIIMFAFLKGVTVKGIASGAAGMALNFNKTQLKKNILKLSGENRGQEYIEDNHMREFQNISQEMDKVKTFIKESPENLRNSLTENLNQMEQLQKDHARTLMRSAHLGGFLKTTDKNKLHHEKENLEIEIKDAKDEVVKQQLSSALEMKISRIAELEKLEVCLQRIKAQRLQISEMFSSMMDKLNALKFADIQTLQASSDKIFKDIKSIRTDLENLEEGLKETESFKSI